MAEKDDVYAVIHTRTTADGGTQCGVNGPYYSTEDATHALQATVASPHSLHAQLVTLDNIEAVSNNKGDLPENMIEAAKIFLSVKNS